MDVGVVMGIYFVGQVVLAGLAEAFGLEVVGGQVNRQWQLLVAYTISGLTMAGLLLAVVRRRGMKLSSLLLVRPRWHDAVYALLGYGAYFLCAGLAFALIDTALPGVDLAQRQNLGLRTLPDALLPLAFLAFVIMPPFTEELLFRGFLYTRMQSRGLCALSSALITSLLFGLLHRQLNVIIDTFILSLVMCYALGIRQSLWVSIGMHMIKNGVAYLGLFIFKIV
jgi:hypothetical protein